MDSYNRNSRTPFHALGVAAAALLLGSGTQAAEGQHNFVLTAYSNGQGGTELVQGNYQAAIKELKNGAAASAAVLSNNRCVAFSVTRQWDEARSACDSAVRDARLEKAALPSYLSWARGSQNDYLAVALSNRAVLHWMSSNPAAAESDLKQAAELAPKAGFVTHNLAALHVSQGSVAQLTAAPRS